MSIARFDLLTLNIERIYRSIETPLLGYSRPMLLPEFREAFRAAIWIGILHVDGMFTCSVENLLGYHGES